MYDPVGHPRNKVFTYWIDIVGTCNLRCPTCPTGNFLDDEFNVGRNPTGFIDIGLYERILDKIRADNVADRIEVHLYNWGEPLLHPKVADIIALTKEKGFYCGVSSNLNLEKQLKDVVKAAPDFLRVSLSGYYQDSYKQTHQRGDIRVVKSNMYRLRTMLDQYDSKTSVQVLYHVYRHNAGDDLAMMIKLCEELGFGLDPVWAFFMPLEKTLDYLDGKITAADQKTIDMLAMDPKEVAEFALPFREADCGLRHSQITMNMDGSVPLCCATFDREHIVAESFLDISHEDLQRARYDNPMCGACMEKGQHVYFSYNVGKKLDELGEETLRANGSKFRFQQFSEPQLVLRDGSSDEAIQLPRAPKKKRPRGLRRLTHALFGR